MELNTFLQEEYKEGEKVLVDAKLFQKIVSDSLQMVEEIRKLNEVIKNINLNVKGFSNEVETWSKEMERR